MKKNKNDSFFWSKIKDSNVNGYFLTSRSSCSQTLIYALKPVLICPQDFNVIPYVPKTAGLIKEIVESVYNVPFNKPKYKNRGGLIDEEIRESFEKKSNNDWLNLKSKYKINALVVPKSWDIDLIKKNSGSDFVFYVIE